MVEPRGDIPGHLHVLNLVPAHGHLVGLEHEDVGGHQDRIGEQAHGDGLVGVPVAPGFVLGNGRLVGVGPVHQTLGRHAGQHPGQFHDFRDIRLPVEHAAGVQAGGQPACGDLQGRTRQLVRVAALYQ